MVLMIEEDKYTNPKTTFLYNIEKKKERRND